MGGPGHQGKNLRFQCLQNHQKLVGAELVGGEVGASLELQLVVDWEGGVVVAAFFEAQKRLCAWLFSDDPQNFD